MKRPDPGRQRPSPPGPRVQHLSPHNVMTLPPRTALDRPEQGARACTCAGQRRGSTRLDPHPSARHGESPSRPHPLHQLGCGLSAGALQGRASWLATPGRLELPGRLVSFSSPRCCRSRRPGLRRRNLIPSRRLPQRCRLRRGLEPHTGHRIKGGWEGGRGRRGPSTPHDRHEDRRGEVCGPFSCDAERRAVACLFLTRTGHCS